MNSFFMQFLYAIPLSFWIISAFYDLEKFWLLASTLIIYTLFYSLFNYVESRYFDMSIYQERDLKLFKIFNVISLTSLLVYLLSFNFFEHSSIYDVIYSVLSFVNLLMFIYFTIRTFGKFPKLLQKSV